MLHPSASAQSISRVYNLSLGIGPDETHLRDRYLGFHTDGDFVLDAFFTHALLRDKFSRHECLHLPHHGLQKDRLITVLNERNFHMAGAGQEYWAHACTGCMRLTKDDQGQSCAYNISTRTNHF